MTDQREAPGPLLDEAIGCLLRASSHSRAHDVLIFRAIGLSDVQERHCAQWIRMDNRPDLSREDYLTAWAPDYSLHWDAAVSLLPPRWYIASLEWNPLARHAGITLHEGDANGGYNAALYRRVSLCAVTAPLAICTASLLARRMMLGQEVMP